MAASDGLELIDIKEIPMLERDKKRKLDVVGGAVTLTHWNPDSYPVTDGQSVGVGYPEFSNRPAWMVGSVVMTPSVSRTGPDWQG